MAPLDSPWTEDYEVLDLSANGDVFLVRSYTDRLNYLYDSTTNERWELDFGDPERDGTARMRLTESDQAQNCLIFDLEFSDTILRDHLWYCEPATGEITFLSSIEGAILEGVISPDQKNVALMVVNDFPMGSFYNDITPGIWMQAMP